MVSNSEPVEERILTVTTCAAFLALGIDKARIHSNKSKMFNQRLNALNEFQKSHSATDVNFDDESFHNLSHEVYDPIKWSKGLLIQDQHKIDAIEKDLECGIFSNAITPVSVNEEGGKLVKRVKFSECIEWAIVNGYEITDDILAYFVKLDSFKDWVARHPHLSETDKNNILKEYSLWESANTEAERNGSGVTPDPLPTLGQDKDTVTEKPWLIHNPKDPEPAQSWYTPARYFARQLILGDPTLLTKRDLLAGKVSTSLKNVGILKRGGKKAHDPSTIKKAFTNVIFD